MFILIAVVNRFTAVIFGSRCYGGLCGTLSSPQATRPQAKVHCHLREDRFKGEGFYFFETKPRVAKANLKSL